MNKHDFENELADEKFDEEWSMSDFKIGKPLGCGRFGKVYLAKEIRTSFQYLIALKIQQKKMLIESETMINFKREYDIQIKLKHPNIICLYGFFHDEQCIHLLLEYAPNGDLYKKIADGPMADGLAATYIYQITRGLEFIHSKCIIHRDIKPENILIGYWGEAKIADFGWANFSNELSKKEEKSLCGTIDYLSPEMILHKPHDTKLDIWCIGVLIYELLVGKAPFYSKKHSETIELIKRVQYNIPNSICGSSHHLIARLLVKKPQDRLECSEILEHDWIEKYANKDESYAKYFKP